MIQIDKENMSSDLILLYNSKFVEKIQKTLLQKYIKNHLNHIEEPIISNLNNQKENLIIIVDFEEEVQLDSEFIQLKYFRDILENLDKNTNYKNIVTIISEIGVLGDETHYFRGKSYNLKIVYNNSAFAELCENEILLYTPSDSIIEERRSIMNKWYRNQLLILIPPIIRKWEKILNVSVDNFFIRKMKTRWGSCTPKSRRIRFNLDLAKVSPEILEYIVIHELIHLIEASHNKKFKLLMDHYLPKWKHFRKELKNTNFMR